MNDFHHRCEDGECVYQGQRTSSGMCKCHKTSEQLMVAEHATLQARIEELTKALEQRWLPVSTYPNDNSVVLVANPDEGRLPVIAWKVEDKWFKYELTERQPLDPQPTIWTEWPKMPRASMVPLERSGGAT